MLTNVQLRQNGDKSHQYEVYNSSTFARGDKIATPRNSADGRQKEGMDGAILTRLLASFTDFAEASKITSSLMSRFGSLAEIISAPRQELEAILGADHFAIISLEVVSVAAKRLCQSEVMSRPIMKKQKVLFSYIRSMISRNRFECAMSLYFDAKNRLIGEEVLGSGDVSKILVAPEAIVRRAVLHNATALVLAHNHPSGDSHPSPEDILLTHKVEMALRAVGIALHDHIIVGRLNCSSIRRMGLIGV